MNINVKIWSKMLLTTWMSMKMSFATLQCDHSKVDTSRCWEIQYTCVLIVRIKYALKKAKKIDLLRLVGQFSYLFNFKKWKLQKHKNLSFCLFLNWKYLEWNVWIAELGVFPKYMIVNFLKLRNNFVKFYPKSWTKFPQGHEGINQKKYQNFSIINIFNAKPVKLVNVM